MELRAEGADRFRVFTPFRFDDGDGFVVVLRRDEGRWFLTDEGNSFLHLSDEFEESALRGGGCRVVAVALTRFGVEDRDGELRPEIPEDRPAEALRSFVGAIGRVAEIAGRSWARFPAAGPGDLA